MRGKYPTFSAAFFLLSKQSESSIEDSDCFDSTIPRTANGRIKP